jgi:Lamin Tail Domain/CotH kinase protein/PA14 domain
MIRRLSWLLAGILAWTLTSFAQNQGAYRELWPNLASDTLGNTLAVLTNTTYNPNWPNNPDPAYTKIYPSFEPDWNTGMNNYGQRVRAYLRAPQTGNYTFWIASDDSSNLFLSTDESPAHSQEIAYVPDWVGFEVWAQEANQQSAPIPLVAGRRYYIEAIMQQGGGGDNLSVGWQLPDGTLERPIPGNRLELDSAPVIITEPADTTVVENSPASFTLGVSDFAPPPAQWQTSGTNIPGATNLTLTIPSAPLSANGSTYRCVVSNAYGNATSTYAKLKVTPDTTPLNLVGAYNLTLTSVNVFFSKAVSPHSATNTTAYALSPPVPILSATMSGPGAVTLTVSPLSLGTNYNLIVNGVADVAATPNVIAPNSQTPFTASSFIPAVVGLSGLPTAAIPAGNGYDITGLGAGFVLNQTSDQFQFNYLPQNGDFDLSVRVQSLTDSNPFAEAGLVARPSLNPSDAFAAALATPSLANCFFASRPSLGAAAATSGVLPVNYPNTWLRLQRIGTQVNGFASYDGVTWSPLGSVSLPAGRLFVGLAVASAAGGPATAQFRDYGNTMSTATGALARPGEPMGPSSRRTPMVFSEIMYKPAARTDGRNLEYLEIYNSNPWWEDIGGYSVAGSVTYTFPQGTILQGGAYLVLAAVPADITAVYGVTNVTGPYNGSLKKTGTLQLLNDVGGVVLDLSYANTLPWPAGADGTGHSLVLSHPSYGEASPVAWSTSDSPGGSPGLPEPFHSTPLRSVVINEFLANPASGQPGFIELYNHSSVPVNIGGCVVTDDAATNKYYFPRNVTMAGHGRASLSTHLLGFALDPSGGAIFLKAPDGATVIDAVSYEPQATGISTGRSPDGAASFYPLAVPTPAKPNSDLRIDDIVVNEIMYKPVSGDPNDQYVELFNKGTNSVDLTGWQFTSGIAFAIPDHTTLAPGAYLVVAASATNLFAHYSHLSPSNTVGDFSGKLPSGGRLALSRPDTYPRTNSDGTVTITPILVIADEVTYSTGGRWGTWAHGGGSSLELINPAVNHHLAYNWADSDETHKSSWTNLTFTGTLDLGANFGSSVDGVQVGLLDVGEALVDNISVSQGAGANLVQNGDFESGLSNWTPQGDHIRSNLETVGGLGGQNSPNAARLRSSDGMWTGANSLAGQLKANNLHQGSSATLKFSARWLRGWPEVLLRLRGNWLELPGILPIPTNLGTPGLPNSRFNPAPPPAIFEVTHAPALPQAGQAVTVTARFHHPSGFTPTLLYRIDTGVTNYSPTYTSVPMTDDGAGGDAVPFDGVFSATIPGQPGGTVVAFVIRATATGGATTTFPRDRDDNAGIPREAVVAFGDPTPRSAFGQYHLWLTQNWIDLWARLGGLSNEFLDGTFVDGGGRIIYNIGGHFAGSPYHQYNGSPVGTLGGQHWSMPDDDLMLGTTSFNKQHVPGNGPLDDQTFQREQTSYWMSRQLKVPWPNRRYYTLYVNGNQHGPIMEDAQVPGADYLKEYFPSDHNGYLCKNNAWFEFEPQVEPGGYVAFNNNSWCTLTRFNTTIPGVGVAPKLARYRWCFWTRQSPTYISDFTDVYNLINTMNFNGSAYYQNVEALVDTEEYLQVSALEHATGDWDSFTTQNQWNMYSYKPQHGKWSLLKWDWNISLGNSGSWGPDGSQILNLTAVDAALSRFETYTPFNRAYLRSLKAIADKAMNNKFVDPVLDAKYAAFMANGVGAAEPGANGLKSWISTMHRSITNALQSRGVLNLAFSLSNPTNIVTGSTNISLNGYAPLEVKTIRVNGLLAPLTWTSVKTWTLASATYLATNVLNLQGYDAYGAAVPNAAATVYVFNTNAPSGQNILPVRINEWMAGNLVTILDPADGKSEDWFELYNPNGTPFDLSGFHLSHDPTNITEFNIPTGTVMAPNAHLLVWADKSLTAANDGGHQYLHASFHLKKAGSSIILSDTAGNVVDSVSFGQQIDDVSEGRYPDGGPLIYPMTSPTPEAPNVFANSPPKLAAITNQSAVVGTQLSFTVAASDPDSPPQSLAFSLDPNGPIGAAIDPVSGVFTWTPTAAGAYSLTVHVTDNGTPALADSESVNIAVADQPVRDIKVLPPSVTGSMLTLNWVAVPGITYRVQYKDSLTDATWIDLPGDIPTTGATGAKTDPIQSGIPHRFYRIKTIP